MSAKCIAENVVKFFSGKCSTCAHVCTVHIIMIRITCVHTQYFLVVFLVKIVISIIEHYIYICAYDMYMLHSHGFIVIIYLPLYLVSVHSTAFVAHLASTGI